MSNDTKTTVDFASIVELGNALRQQEKQDVTDRKSKKEQFFSWLGKNAPRVIGAMKAETLNIEMIPDMESIQSNEDWESAKQVMKETALVSAVKFTEKFTKEWNEQGFNVLIDYSKTAPPAKQWFDLVQTWLKSAAAKLAGNNSQFDDVNLAAMGVQYKMGVNCLKFASQKGGIKQNSVDAAIDALNALLG